jgi:hypothetical protein
VQREIEAALERENLDRERGMAGDADADAAHGDVKNSTVLLGDLEEVRQKVDRYRVRASLADHLSVKEARDAVASCYQYILSLSFGHSFIRSFFFLHTERIQQRLLIAGRKWLHFAVRWPRWSRLYPFSFIPCLAVNADLVTSSNMLPRYGSRFVAFIDILQPRIID